MGDVHLLRHNKPCREIYSGMCLLGIRQDTRVLSDVIHLPPLADCTLCETPAIGNFWILRAMRCGTALTRAKSCETI